VQLSGNVSYNQPLTLAGGGVNGVSAVPGGLTGALDNRSGDNTWAGAITLAGTGVNGNDPLENQIGSTSGSLRVSGVIRNATGIDASWAKTGAGDVVLSGSTPNTYTGLTRQFGGRLIVEKDGALGSPGSPFEATGNTFQLADSASTLAFRAPAGSAGFTYSTFEVINTHGTGAPGFGQIDNLGGDNVFDGHIAIGGPPSAPVAQSGSIGVTSGSLTLTGGLYARKGASESGHRVITKLGEGTLVLAGNSNVLPPNPAVARLPMGSTFNVDAGTVALTGVGSSGPNVLGITTWNVANDATLRLHQGGAAGAAVLNLTGGTLAAGASLVAANAVNLGAGGGTIDTAANAMALTGAVSGAGGLTKTGAGAATLAGAVNGISGGALAVTNGTLAVAPAGDVSRMMTVNSIAIAPGTRLDLADNDILVDYAAGSSPYDTLRGYVRAGRAAGDGIISSTSAGDTVLALGDNADLQRAAHRDVPIDTSTIIGMHTYYGDANLDGKVTGDDYVAVDSNLGTGSRWTQGDFNFDGIVSGDDYVPIDANLGKGTGNLAALAALKQEMIALHAEMFGEPYLASLAVAEAEGFAALVPEPGGLIVLPIALGMMSRRRRA
jgi:autotransporter-associated beta strand protein